MNNTTTISKLEPSPTGQTNSANHLEMLICLSSLMNSSLEVSEIREQAINAVNALVNCQAASLLLVNRETGGLYFDVAVGNKGNDIKKIELSKGQGIAGWVAENNTPIIIENAQNDARFFKKADLITGFKTRNMICVPVTTKSKTIGVLQAINKHSTAFNEDDARLLTALSNQIGIALENARLYDEVKVSLYSVVSVLASTIEKRDPTSTGHAKRVARYALAIGKQMGLTRAELVNLKLASVLHDVGMITVPDNILQKKTRILESERIEIMKHVNIGAEILNEVKPLQKIIPAVKYHHEHYDGSGHFGLKGKSIPLFARIICVADAFDAMTTGRLYRRCKGYDSARQELSRLSGIQFDPDIVNAFMESKAFRHVAKYYNA